MSVTQPDFTYAWASEGGMTAPSLQQLLNGWAQKQFPPSEVSNFLQNKVDTAIRYIFQVGISNWVEYLEYQPSNLVAYGGRHWIAKQPSLNKMPAEGAYWRIAFDEYGATDDLKAEIVKILGQDGYIPWYVKKSDPVMTGKAKAPSYEADVGAGAGYQFKNYQSGMTCIGGDLVFMASGKASGRIKPDAKLETESDPLVLVNVGMIAELVANIYKAVQLPIGYSVVTRNSSHHLKQINLDMVSGNSIAKEEHLLV